MRNQYDVPLPNIEDLITPGMDSVARIQAAESFIHLCTLSEILGDILPIAYDLRTDEKDLQRTLRRLEYDLDDWTTNLPEYFNVTNQDHRSNYSTEDLHSSFASLRFCFLSTKLLISRVALRVGFVPFLRPNRAKFSTGISKEQTSGP